MNMKSKVMRITIPAIMAALSILLELISGKTGWAKFTIHGIPLMFTGIMFGPLTGLTTGFVTGLLVQLNYPFSIASPFYAISYVMWALIPGLLSKLFKNKNSVFLIILSAIFAAIFANLANTGAMMIDALFVDGSYFTVAAILTKWSARIITMIFMFAPNIFLLERSINALFPLAIGEEIRLTDFTHLQIPEINKL